MSTTISIIFGFSVAAIMICLSLWLDNGLISALTLPAFILAVLIAKKLQK